MSAPTIALRDVLFRWHPAAPPCIDIESLVIAAGERIFLHGSSGSGKSTLLSLIGGVITPERGAVEVLGADLALQRPAERDRHRSEHLGFIFQMFNLLPYLSALDNILLPCRFSRRRRMKIAAAGTTAKAEAERLAARLDLAPGLLARPATALSVGQQQRVAAARALIGRPELVIADEPTSSLDAARQQGFLELLLTECAVANAAVLFVSHDSRLAVNFDRALALADINRAPLPEGAAG